MHDTPSQECTPAPGSDILRLSVSRILLPIPILCPLPFTHAAYLDISMTIEKCLESHYIGMANTPHDLQLAILGVV